MDIYSDNDFKGAMLSALGGIPYAAHGAQIPPLPYF